MLKLYRQGLVLFALLAALAALDAALAAAGVVSWFNGLRWLRVHLVTLGIITQLTFGLILWRPWLVDARSQGTQEADTASRARRRDPGEHPSAAKLWQPRATNAWLLLVAGIATLLVGIPLVNQPIIVSGGLLVMTSVAVTLRDQVARPDTGVGRPFFVAALIYLLFGAFVGAGLWLGWGRELGMSAPREVHIHANTWGFLSLAFAGLLAETIRPMQGQGVRRASAWRWILWLLGLSGVLLLVGPWIGSMPIQGAGVLMHLVASAWVLVLIVPPLRHSGAGWQPRSVHLVAGYAWILGLAAMVPVVMLYGTEFTLAAVEETAPQVLVYGWALQVAIGLTPRPWLATVARPVGGWLTLLSINAGAALLAVSILVPARQGPLYGLGYGLLALGLAIFASRLRARS